MPQECNVSSLVMTNKKPKKDPDYYIESAFVVFQVEDDLFRVPSYRFTNESQIFAGMFSMPQPDAHNMEGSSPENPIRLPRDILSEDFKNLMMVLYPRASFLHLSLNQAQWISVLKLATMWYFLDLRKMAISELERIDSLTPLDKITLGRKVKVSSWVITGFEAMIQRNETISDEEVAAVEWPTAIRLFRIREFWLTNRYHYRTRVEEDFKDELDAIRSDEKGYAAVVEVQPEAFYYYDSD